jgi:hypothetical protein
VETSREPDFRFRSKRSGREFLVEAKHRSRFYQGGVEWCKPYQLRRYRANDQTVPVFIAIGLGGTPDSPGHVYIVPMRHIRYRRLFPSFLRHYEVPPGQYVNMDRALLPL